MLQIKRIFGWLTVALSPFMVTSCGNDSGTRLQENDLIGSAQNVESRALLPLPEKVSKDNDHLIILGERLFHDPRLSLDQHISCASCHVLSAGGDDNMPVSLGIESGPGALNAPTVLNSALNFRQFWDGRAASLEEQIEGPIHNEKEMGASWSLIISRLEQDEYYQEMFSQYFSDGINADNIKRAIAEFERSLITRNSPFDKFLGGDFSALSPLQRKGYEKFQSFGCISCHQGANIGGNMYQRIGIMDDYFKDRGNIVKEDLGLYNLTKKEEDRYKFKVPSLRNIALTAPYFFHDGQTPSLKQAIWKMAYYQLGERLKEEDVIAIEAFLNSLTGELDVTHASTSGRTQ